MHINFVMLVSTAKGVRNMALILVSDLWRRGWMDSKNGLEVWEGGKGKMGARKMG